MRITFSAQVTAADSARRTIAGRIVTFGEEGSTSAGPTVFAAGSITVPDDVRLVLEHDDTRPIGRAVELSHHDDGIDGVFRITGTRAGDDALVEAADGLRDGFSVGVDVEASDVVDGRLIVTASRLAHVGLVAHPAIDSARVSRVAASETEPEGTPEMSETETVEVEEVVEVVETVEASRPVPIRTTPRAKPFEGPNAAAEYLLAFVAASRGDRDAGQRVQAALGQQGLADNPGIVPAPIVGNVIDVLNGSRPVIASSTSRQMPAGGSQFSRPKIATHSTSAAQSAEFAILSSTKMSITGTNVVKSTHGGALSISFQDRDWTDPALLSIVIADLAKAYAVDTETTAATYFAGAITQTEGDGVAPDAETMVKGLYLAAAKVNAGCGQLPDTLWAAPDQWALLGGLVDAAKRPIFPSMGPVNAGGVLNPTSFSGNPLGLNLVVASHLPAGTMIIGASEFYETYEQIGGNLSATNVSTLSFDVAYYGYFAELVTVPNAFCKMTNVAPVAAKK